MFAKHKAQHMHRISHCNIYEGNVKMGAPTLHVTVPLTSKISESSCKNPKNTATAISLLEMGNTEKKITVVYSWEILEINSFSRHEKAYRNQSKS